MNNEQLWQAVLGELELLISKANFTTWFKSTFIISSDNETVLVATPNAFTKNWLEKKYSDQLLRALKNITSDGVKKINFTVETKKPIAGKQMVDAVAPRLNSQTSATGENTDKQDINKFGLNPKYTFENFIVGKGNELAHAAARAVAQKLGQVYNPLFIYGGVGLGKTHLVQAVGNEIIKNNPKLRILYINSERFTNDYVQAIKSGQTESFKKQYRTVDVLLIDDIHFMAGKEQTQEEFFHTFNALHQNNKQIILSSDRPPKAIPDVEQRLISRFEWGMTADVSSPDFETRIAILQAKCQEKSLDLSAEIISYLAENVQNNVRELEGALNRIIGVHELNKSVPTLESTKQVLQALTASSPKGNLTPKKIIQAVSSYFDVSIENIVGACRRKELVLPRQIVMYLMREEINASYPSIGQELGGRDHTTAIHACNKIIDVLTRDEKMKNDISMIKQRLYHA
ncbi:MAG: chromosomal replication initiator protein DnaA [Candidatus Komeilibacteria bacterium]|nr:chromosomal replication initiator protein DnaA [Candidatus Komeilibacteria bacterium]